MPIELSVWTLGRGGTTTSWAGLPVLSQGNVAEAGWLSETRGPSDLERLVKPDETIGQL